MAARNLLVFFAIAAFAASLGFVALKSRHATSAKAAQLMGAVERLATYPGISDPDRLAKDFRLPLRLHGKATRQTSCAGRPVQTGATWQSWNGEDAWFTSDLKKHPQAAFLLRVDDEPPVCRSEPASYPIAARFVFVQAWRCVTQDDLGPLAADFKTTSNSHGVVTMTKDAPRADGRLARVELNFGAGNSGPCLFSASVILKSF